MCDVYVDVKVRIKKSWTFKKHGWSFYMGLTLLMHYPKFVYHFVGGCSLCLEK